MVLVGPQVAEEWSPGDDDHAAGGECRNGRDEPLLFVESLPRVQPRGAGLFVLLGMCSNESKAGCRLRDESFIFAGDP